MDDDAGQNPVEKAGCRPRPGHLKVVPMPLDEAAQTRTQTFLQFLEEFVETVRSGAVQPTGCMIFWLDQEWKPHTWVKHTTIPEQIAYGSLIVDMGLAEWRGER